jgi:hypothetical protein
MAAATHRYQVTRPVGPTPSRRERKSQINKSSQQTEQILPRQESGELENLKQIRCLSQRAALGIVLGAAGGMQTCRKGLGGVDSHWVLGLFGDGCAGHCVGKICLGTARRTSEEAVSATLLMVVARRCQVWRGF